MTGRLAGGMLLLMLALGVAACQNPERKPFLFEIPEGYQGWVSVRFFKPDCPELPVEGDKPVVRIPASGRLCTTSPMGFGHPTDEFYFVDASGKRTDAADRIHQEHVAMEGASPDKQIYERFFVGTDADFANAPHEPSEE